MLETFHHLRLEAVACALPEQTRRVADFADAFGANTTARFQKVVGIEAFPVAPEALHTADLAEAAARALMASGKFRAEAIDLILFVSQTPEAVAPATSALLQARLGLPERVFALDINQGCAGFLAGLLTAAQFVHPGGARKALILGGDTLSRHVNPADPTAAMLFGDAGFAAVIGLTSEQLQAPPWFIASATAGGKAIEIPFGSPFRMAGMDVFNFTVTRVPEQIQDVLRAAGRKPAQIDLLLLHQANAFIVRQIARLCGFSEEQTPCRMMQRGNTSSASLPLLLCDLTAEGLTGRKQVLLSAFGVGMTWLSALLDIDFAACLPPIFLPSPNGKTSTL